MLESREAMPKLWTALFGTLAFLWLVETVRLLWGIADLPRLADGAPLADAECPIVSILVAAHAEAAGLPQALPTLLEQDYPHYEMILVNDRSKDATPQIL